MSATQGRSRSKKVGHRQHDGASLLGFAIGGRFLGEKRRTIKKSDRDYFLSRGETK